MRSSAQRVGETCLIFGILAVQSAFASEDKFERPFVSGGVDDKPFIPRYRVPESEATLRPTGVGNELTDLPKSSDSR